MGTSASTQEASDVGCTLCSLPDEILEKIIRALTFRDKCALELVGRQFYTLLSNPLPMEELWGRCDFTSDLKLGDNFHCKEDITRCVACCVITCLFPCNA